LHVRTNGMRASARNFDLIEDLNSVLLKEEELFKVIDDYRQARDAGMCSVVTGRIAEKTLSSENPGKAKAILCRLQALSQMIENRDLNNWLFSDGICVMPSIANKALVSAAAVHPLSVIDGGIKFEKESFLARILELVETEGSDGN